MTNTQTAGISVILCCYNSSNKLEPTLQALALQQLPMDLPCEIVLVDNASTDDTTARSIRIWQTLGSPYPLVTVSETQPGLTYARKKGLHTATFPIVVFCDDDNRLAANYLHTAWQIMQENPEIGILGGYATPVSDQPLPEWFTTYQAYYALGVQALNSGEVSADKIIWGAGIMLRKSMYSYLESISFVGIMQDQTGKKLWSGGDAGTATNSPYNTTYPKND